MHFPVCRRQDTWVKLAFVTMIMGHFHISPIWLFFFRRKISPNSRVAIKGQYNLINSHHTYVR